MGNKCTSEDQLDFVNIKDISSDCIGPLSPNSNYGDQDQVVEHELNKDGHEGSYEEDVAKNINAEVVDETTTVSSDLKFGDKSQSKVIESHFKPSGKSSGDTVENDLKLPEIGSNQENISLGTIGLEPASPSSDEADLGQENIVPEQSTKSGTELQRIIQYPNSLHLIVLLVNIWYFTHKYRSIIIDLKLHTFVN